MFELDEGSITFLKKIQIFHIFSCKTLMLLFLLDNCLSSSFNKNMVFVPLRLSEKSLGHQSVPYSLKVPTAQNNS